MAKFELPIYGKNDEVIKLYETNRVAWGVFVQAASLQETISSKSVREQIEDIGEILKSVFVGLTNEELLSADAFDVMSTFEQIVSGGQKIKKSSSKNA